MVFVLGQRLWCGNVYEEMGHVYVEVGDVCEEMENVCVEVMMVLEGMDV